MFHGFVVNAIEWRIVLMAIIIAEFQRKKIEPGLLNLPLFEVIIKK